MQHFKFCRIGISAAVLLTCRPAIGQSDVLEIRSFDGTPLKANATLTIDYQIGTSPLVQLKSGDTLPPISIPEGATESTPEPKVVVHINFSASFNGDLMRGPGTRNAWLLEPPDPITGATPLSDVMQVVTVVNPTNSAMRDYTFTLISDPIPGSIIFQPLPTDFVRSETGGAQNLSNFLFFPDPGTNETVPPWTVLVKSDVEGVPEPASLLLLASTVPALVSWTFRRR
jgi:hypothetical protein